MVTACAKVFKFFARSVSNLNFQQKCFSKIKNHYLKRKCHELEIEHSSFFKRRNANNVSIATKCSMQMVPRGGFDNRKIFPPQEICLNIFWNLYRNVFTVKRNVIFNVDFCSLNVTFFYKPLENLQNRSIQIV